ncbi:MAG: response regulator [Rhodospirillaceae bacterium]|nr:response regulator [Rhodospirillales bacterium]
MKAPHETTLMVVEDEYLVAMSIELALQDAGYAVVGPIPSVDKALEAIAGQPADLALLDVNLAGHRVYPVADALSSRQVPFIFLTGCDGTDLPPRFADVPILVKPFSAKNLLLAIGRTLGQELPRTMPTP